MHLNLRESFGGGVALVAVGLGFACGDSSGGGGAFVDAAGASDASDRDGMIILPGFDSAPAVDAQVDDEGPTLEVLTPTANMNDFSSDAIVTRERVQGRCRATPNSSTGVPVDATSVKMLAVAGGEQRESFAQPTSVANEFEADLNVSGFPNGPLEIRCTASDTAATPRTNTASVSTFLDLGPRVDVITPVENTSYANQVDVRLSVVAQPIASGDTAGSEVDFDNVQVFVSGVLLTDITHNGSGVYQGTVDFDAAIFNPTLDGPQTLVIRAPNKRSSTPVTRVTSVVFTADSDGPIITIENPDPGDLVSGIVNVTANISDPAGVDQLGVVGSVAGQLEFPLVSTGGDTYQGFFDSRSLGLGMVFPTIIIRAQDGVGNQSANGFVVGLDNVPPIASMDPPDIREGDFSQLLARLECSLVFDPLGPDSANDTQVVPQLSEIRARIEDLGNSASATEGVLIPTAGVDFDNTRLYILDDATGALVVDTDNDGICDAINPLLVPTSVPQLPTEAATINLLALQPAGGSEFGIDLGHPPGSPYPVPWSTPVQRLDCYPPSLPPDAIVERPPICGQSPGERIIKSEIGQDPVIFTIPPRTDPQCWGNAFDSAATNISDGWACLAIEVKDNLDNSGVSAPLRLCFDRDLSGDDCDGVSMGQVWNDGAQGGPMPHHCSGVYDESTQTVVPGSSCTYPASFVDFPWLQVRRRDL